VVVISAELDMVRVHPWVWLGRVMSGFTVVLWVESGLVKTV